MQLLKHNDSPYSFQPTSTKNTRNISRITIKRIVESGVRSYDERERVVAGVQRMRRKASEDAWRRQWTESTTPQSRPPRPYDGATEPPRQLDPLSASPNNIIYHRKRFVSASPSADTEPVKYLTSPYLSSRLLSTLFSPSAGRHPISRYTTSSV